MQGSAAPAAQGAPEAQDVPEAHAAPTTREVSERTGLQGTRTRYSLSQMEKGEGARLKDTFHISIVQLMQLMNLKVVGLHIPSHFSWKIYVHRNENEWPNLLG